MKSQEHKVFFVDSSLAMKILTLVCFKIFHLIYFYHLNVLLFKNFLNFCLISHGFSSNQF